MLSIMLRQSKPKSNTRVFGLGFSLQKIRFYLRFSFVARRRFSLFGVRTGVFVSLLPYRKSGISKQKPDVSLFGLSIGF